jgi:hypothetical protein
MSQVLELAHGRNDYSHNHVEQLRPKHESGQLKPGFAGPVQAAVRGGAHLGVGGVEEPQAGAGVGAVEEGHQDDELVGCGPSVLGHGAREDAEDNHPKRLEREQAERPLLDPRVVEHLARGGTHGCLCQRRRSAQME